jgi:ribose 5-phosphate isomerase RpiB
MILIEKFLSTDFKKEEKYLRRIKKIEEYENKYR